MKLTYWVVESVVSTADLGARVGALVKFVQVARYLQVTVLIDVARVDCEQSPLFRDYQGFMAVMTGLQMCSV